MVRLAIALGPIAVATAIAASRLTDYRHHFSDVNAGRRGGRASAVACGRSRSRPPPHCVLHVSAVYAIPLVSSLSPVTST